MTPAEKPSDMDNSLVLVFREKKARALPIPVDKPAKKVSPKAIKITSFSN
jgi:hypothetical protein